MSIGTVSAHAAADRGLSAPSARPLREAEAEPAIAPPDLYAATTANSRTPLAGLVRTASEANRLDSLIAAAKAAAVRLVTEPVAAAPAEKVKTVAELTDGVRLAGQPDAD